MYEPNKWDLVVRSIAQILKCATNDFYVELTQANGDIWFLEASCLGRVREKYRAMLPTDETIGSYLRKQANADVNAALEYLGCDILPIEA